MADIIEHKRLFELYLDGIAKKRNSTIIPRCSLNEIKHYLNDKMRKIDTNLKRRIESNNFFLMTLSDNEESVICVLTKQTKVWYTIFKGNVINAVKRNLEYNKGGGVQSRRNFPRILRSRTNILQIPGF